MDGVRFASMVYFRGLSLSFSDIDLFILDVSSFVIFFESQLYPRGIYTHVMVFPGDWVFFFS